MRESYPLTQSEEYIGIVMALNPAEQKLIYRLRQLAREQCRGAVLLFEEGGFCVYKLDGKKPT